MSEKLALLEQWMQRVWTEQDAGAIDELLAEIGEMQGLGNQELVGPEAFKEFHQALCGLLGDFVITIDHSLEQGDWISALLTVNAKSLAKGLAVQFTGSVWGEIKNGQVQQAYNHIDFMGLFAQLGLLPFDCFEQGLSGSRIT